jgi:hypothetical protein
MNFTVSKTVIKNLLCYFLYKTKHLYLFLIVKRKVLKNIIVYTVKAKKH